MIVAPHWALRSYLREIREGEDSNSKHDARLYVLIVLILHANNRLRCWPSTKVICQETGFNSPSIVEARDWLLSRKAIILVPYEKREGEEITLPKRQFVYQLTGAMMTKKGIQPYLVMSPETEEQLKRELAQLGFEVSQTETSQTKTSVRETKGITSFKGSTNKKKNGAKAPIAAKPKAERKPDPLFDLVALKSFGFKSGTAGIPGARIGVICRYLNGSDVQPKGRDLVPGVNPPAALPEVEAFYTWVEQSEGGVTLRDVQKFAEYFIRFRAQCRQPITLVQDTAAGAAERAMYNREVA